MKPEKLVGIMLITLLLSCEMEEQHARLAGEVDQKTGEVSFETNQHIMNSTFDIDIYVDDKKIGSINNRNYKTNPSDIIKEKIKEKLQKGVHNYEVKIYSYNGESGKKIKGTFIVRENKTSEVFIDFKDYNNWM